MPAVRPERCKVVGKRQKSCPFICNRITRHSINGNKSLKPRYDLVCTYTEDHKSTIFCVQFNHFVTDISIFACTAGNRVSIYQCVHQKLKFLQAYADPKEQEKFFTCAWSYNMYHKPILAVAGHLGIIKILNTSTKSTVGSLTGHGQEINEINFHPNKPNILVSASMDYTVRLWNVETLVCIAVFGGADGHRDAVTSVNFDLHCSRLVSGGIDHAVKIWNIDTLEMQELIDKSNYHHKSTADHSFPTYIEHFPDFSTRDAHTDYVDCVAWFGDIVISRSCDRMLKFWKPLVEMNNLVKTESVQMIKEIKCDNCDLFFLKFSTDFFHKTLTLGNTCGRIFVWNLNVPDPDLLSYTVLSHPRCTSTLRHTSLSRDGQILIAASDDGCIWRWERCSF